MGDGTEKKPYTREDVLRLIRKNGGTAAGLDLSGKEFEDGIDLSGLDLSGIILRGVDLIRAHLERTTLFLADFQGSLLLEVHLEEANLIRADLQWTTSYNVHLEGVSLHGTSFYPHADLEFADWGNYIVGEEKRGMFGSAANTYRLLKVYYTEHGIYDVAGKFYYREMEARRKALKWRSKEWHHRLYTECMWALFGYGEKWWRVVYWMAAFLILFAAAYHFWGKLEPLDSLYFSAVSFTALGYGRWALEPIGWVKGLGAFEAFVGVFMMALLLVTFVRKWTR
jgi:hypothetical protein